MKPRLSYRSPKTEVRESPIQGRGLFAREPIAEGEIVAVKGGHVFDASGLRDVERDLGPAEIQVADDLFIGPVVEEEREEAMLFTNHSCDPNIGVQGQIVFVAMRDIEAGEELTHDWATTDDDSYEMDCNCGASNCRDTITGRDWRRKELQERYRGYFSWYLQRKIDEMDDLATLMQRAARARREGRSEDARRDYAAAVARCRAEGTRRVLAQALEGLGQVERDLGHGEAALSLYEEAAQICRERGEPLAIAHTIRHVGDLYREAGRIGEAEFRYEEALGIYREHERMSPLDLANALRPLAILREEQGEVGEAVRLWTEARDLYDSLDVDEGVAECGEHLARLTE